MMMSDPKPAPEDEDEQQQEHEGGEHEGEGGDPPAPEQAAQQRVMYARPKRTRRTREMKPDPRPGGGYQTR